MKRTIISILIILLCCSFATAYTIPDNYDGIEDLKDDLILNSDKLITEYNDHVQEMPSTIKYLLKNQEINIYIDDEFMLSVVFEESNLKSISEEELERSTLDIYSSTETIEMILNNEISLYNAYQKGAITHKANTFRNKLKFGIGNLALSVLKMFN